MSHPTSVTLTEEERARLETALRHVRHEELAGVAGVSVSAVSRAQRGIPANRPTVNAIRQALADAERRIRKESLPPRVEAVPLDEPLRQRLALALAAPEGARWAREHRLTPQAVGGAAAGAPVSPALRARLAAALPAPAPVDAP